ncbi:DedA family protein [Gordonia sp. ABSL1-1]|uniref:DedA family protein n=1 Tax=Gordonia sp. ABSL1-1 TaxID=3053923 RepID=UPI00257366C6|nr:DedA family protein [Gordonia sp. ABSL1-1]MDL9936589.1 DedA family protein [Gordonia sp. ABSL1-1]
MHTLADRLVDLIASVPSWAVYLVACGVVYVETATLVVGLIMPSEAVLVAAGVAAAVGPTDVGGLLPAAIIAAIAGDLTGYEIGRRSGPRVMASGFGRRIGEHRWQRARDHVDSGGFVAVATGRWIGFVRTVVPPVAGMTGMHRRRFAAADVVGTASWASAVVLLGYFAGAALGTTILFYTGVAAALGALGWYGIRWLRTRARTC